MDRLELPAFLDEGCRKPVEKSGMAGTCSLLCRSRSPSSDQASPKVVLPDSVDDHVSDVSGWAGGGKPRRKLRVRGWERPGANSG